MGVMGGFRVGIGLTHHHQGAVLHRRFDALEFGQAHQGVGGGHPPEVELTPLHRLHLLPGPEPRGGSNLTLGESPGLLHLTAVLVIGDHPVSGQEMGQATCFPASHRIRLACEGEGAGTFFADLAREQVQVDQALHHGGAFPPLVHAHRPKAQHPLFAVEQLGHLPQPFFRDAAEAGHLAGGPAGHHIEEGFVVLGVIVDKGHVLAVFAHHQMGNAMQQGQISARCNR